MSILELLHHIVNEPAPRLVSQSREFPASATSFIENCLDKEPGNRKSPQELLVSASRLFISKLTRKDFRLGRLRESFGRRYSGMGKEDRCGRRRVMRSQSVFQVLTLICICLFIRLVTIMYFICTLARDSVHKPVHRFRVYYATLISRLSKSIISHYLESLVLPAIGGNRSADFRCGTYTELALAESDPVSSVADSESSLTSSVLFFTLLKILDCRRVVYHVSFLPSSTSSLSNGSLSPE